MGRTQSRAERLKAMETFLFRSPAGGRKVNNIIRYHPDNSVTLCLHLLFVKMAKGHLKPYHTSPLQIFDADEEGPKSRVLYFFWSLFSKTYTKIYWRIVLSDTNLKRRV